MYLIRLTGSGEDRSEAILDAEEILYILDKGNYRKIRFKRTNKDVWLYVIETMDEISGILGRVYDVS